MCPTMSAATHGPHEVGVAAGAPATAAANPVRSAIMTLACFSLAMTLNPSDFLFHSLLQPKSMQH